MAQYRQKPVVIKAVQYTGNNLDEILQFGGEDIEDFGGQVRARTKDGTMEVAPKSWVIRDITGKHYPCPDEVFQQTYELFEPTDLADKVPEAEPVPEPVKAKEKAPPVQQKARPTPPPMKKLKKSTR